MTPQNTTSVDNEQGNESSSIWRMVSLILGIILVGSTLFGITGKAFYVSRSEYSEKTQNNAVELSQVHMAIDSIKFSMKDQSSQHNAAVDTIKTTLKEQEQAFRVMTETVNNLKNDAFRNTRQRIQ